MKLIRSCLAPGLAIAIGTSASATETKAIASAEEEVIGVDRSIVSESLEIREDEGLKGLEGLERLEEIETIEGIEGTEGSSYLFTFREYSTETQSKLGIAY